ncbi:MAG: SAM-dependent methyltransferase [Verrucomicrobiales bacterium]
MSAATAVSRAEAYYDSPDADEFYYRVWGGEDIHVGIYESPEEPIATASRRTVERMIGRLSGLKESARILDIGSGYGGSARHIVNSTPHTVVCLNLSKVQNERNRAMNQEQGLSKCIEVVDGNFEDLPFEPSSFDAVWSQDAILHSADRMRVIHQVARILRPGGDFVFTDPMQADTADPQSLQPVLERIHLDSLGSFAFYRQAAAQVDWKEVLIEDLSEQLTMHYTRVRAELEKRDQELSSFCSRGYRERMKIGLGHWIEAGRRHDLSWGILHFQKKAASA